MLINTKQLAHFSRGLLGSLQVAPPLLQCTHLSQQVLLATAYSLSELVAVNNHRPMILQQHRTTANSTGNHYHFTQQIRSRECKQRCMTEAVQI